MLPAVLLSKYHPLPRIYTERMSFCWTAWWHWTLLDYRHILHNTSAHMAWGLGIGLRSARAWCAGEVELPLIRGEGLSVGCIFQPQRGSSGISLLKGVVVVSVCPNLFFVHLD